MALRAAFFDVGDTLVEHWAPREKVIARARARICEALGERAWLDDLLEAEIEPIADVSLAESLLARGATEGRFEPATSRQETEQWYRGWFTDRGIEFDPAEFERLRPLLSIPLDEISTPVAGAAEALRWCAERGLRVVLITNTLTRGDAEVIDDWQRFGMKEAVHGVVSSHSVGWRKPHPAIFERALEIAGARPEEAFHVGDNLIADVYGARQLGIRAIWRPRAARSTYWRQPPPTDERGTPVSREKRERTERCRHPSEHLFLEESVVGCLRCGEPVRIEITPDAVVADLTEIPRVVSPWLEAAA